VRVPALLVPGLLAVAPLTPGRSEARDLLRRELLRPEYHRNDPSLVERALRWVLDAAQRLLSQLDPHSSGIGWVALLVLAAAIAVLVVLVRRRVGPLARSGVVPALFSGRTLPADEHRARADAAAASGRYAEAVRERWRGLVRGAEERGLLDPRPGRTVDEAARDVAAVLPGTSAALAEAARAFDEIWYAGASATSAHDTAVRAADERTRQARPASTLR
jgi:hypothetical protein